MKRKNNRITIKDVARFANVSPATVSNVLNDAPNVGDATRQTVLDAVKKLNYRPNTVARSLRKKHTHTIGIVTDELSDSRFVMPMMKGIDEGASRAGFSILLSNSFGDRQQEKSVLGMLLDKQTDGIILMGGKVEARGVPALELGFNSTCVSLPVHW